MLRPAPGNFQRVANPSRKLDLEPATGGDATVPGTVLTTMINQGVYPDPGYGAEQPGDSGKFEQQDIGIAASSRAPAEWKGQRLTLTFEGINLRAAEVWFEWKADGNDQGRFHSAACLM